MAEGLKPFVNDYRVNVFEIPRLTAEQVEQFKSDFRIVADYFVQMGRDEGLLRELLSEYEGIRDRLEGLAESGKLTEYVKRTLEEMSGKVLEHIARGHEKVREGVKSIMGGQVLEYEAKTILREGIALGEARGIKLGRNEGIASTARRMLGMRFTSEQISQATGLSPDEVAALRRGMD